jgi:hypothetical protein
MSDEHGASGSYELNGAPSPDEEERLGHRKSFWGRMRNRLSFLQVPTQRANEGMDAIGMQGDNPRAGFHG